MHNFAAVLVVALSASACGSLNPYATSTPKRVPGLHFDSVVQSGDVTTILVSFERVRVDDTWNLRYASGSTTTLGGYIGVDLPVTSRKIEWNSQETPSGTYYLFGELSSLGGVYTASAPEAVLVRGTMVSGNAAPTAMLSFPSGGQHLTRGSTVDVQYVTSDLEGEAPTVALEISSDSGNTWSTLAAGLGAEGPYAWAIPADQPVGLSYKLRVVATDVSGAIGASSSRRVFSIE